ARTPRRRGSVEIRHAGISAQSRTDEAHRDRQGHQARSCRRRSRGPPPPGPGAQAGEPVVRAAIVREFGGVENISVAETSDPVPGPGELLIEIHAAPVNYADLLVIAGRYQTRPLLPFTPGKGAAGVVAGVGDAVTRFRDGDRVFAWVEEGGYAEMV